MILGPTSDPRPWIYTAYNIPYIWVTCKWSWFNSSMQYCCNQPMYHQCRLHHAALRIYLLSIADSVTANGHTILCIYSASYEICHLNQCWADSDATEIAFASERCRCHCVCRDQWIQRSLCYTVTRRGERIMMTIHTAANYGRFSFTCN